MSNVYVANNISILFARFVRFTSDRPNKQPKRKHIHSICMLGYVECDLLLVSSVSHAELVLQRTDTSPEGLSLFMQVVMPQNA